MGCLGLSHVDSGIINVRSQRQAEDWSVVLLSQGIESTIEPGAEPEQWQLLVDRENYGRALRILRLYIIENKRPVWVQPVPWTGGLIFDWRSPIWFALLAVLFYLSTYRAPGVRDLGVVDSGRVGPVVLRSVLGGVLLLVLVGFDPASDVVAHVSGFVLGGLFGAIVRAPWCRSESADTIAGLICGALAGLCWWLALR